jgi:hypothetical protein
MIKTFNKIWGVFGVVVTASSLFSLLQRGFEIPLGISFIDVLYYYRSIVQPIFEFCYKPIYWLFPSFYIPVWITDLQVISIAVTGIYIKAKSSERVNGEQIHFKTFFSKVHTMIVVGFTMIGLLFLPIILYAMLFIPIAYVNNLRWYSYLKWYNVKEVLGHVYRGSGTEYGLWTIAGIYGYFTLIALIAFLLFNSILP